MQTQERRDRDKARKQRERANAKPGDIKRHRDDTRQRIPTAKAKEVLAKLEVAPEIGPALVEHFGTEKKPVMLRSFDVALETYARFRKIVTPRIKGGQTTETDCINEALAQWCDRQENHANPDNA